MVWSCDFLSVFRTTIWEPDHLTTGHVWPIRILDLSGIEMVTVLTNFDLTGVQRGGPIHYGRIRQLLPRDQLRAKCRSKIGHTAKENEVGSVVQVHDVNFADISVIKIETCFEWGYEIWPIEIQNYSKSVHFEGRVSSGFWQNGAHLSRFQMVLFPDFRAGMFSSALRLILNFT